ncbi:MAG: hypothetical protein ABI589_01445 [Burkholderiales bacterium]
MSKKFTAASIVAMAALLSSTAFAQSGGITIPGVGSAKGSIGSDIKNSHITVSNNKARDVTAGGGKIGIKIAEVSMDGIANVNSVNITGSRVTDSTISVIGNEADGIRAIGGTANVNTVNIN